MTSRGSASRGRKGSTAPLVPAGGVGCGTGPPRPDNPVAASNFKEKLVLVHLELEEANDFISTHHRHHRPVVGHLGVSNAMVREVVNR